MKKEKCERLFFCQIIAQCEGARITTVSSGQAAGCKSARSFFVILNAKIKWLAAQTNVMRIATAAFSPMDKRRTCKIMDLTIK